MKKGLAALAIFALTAVSCGGEETVELTTSERLAVNVVEDVEDVRDHKTGICFAVYTGYRRAAISSIPCEQVPADLLVETGGE